MQFSDTTNDTGLVEDIDFICGTDTTSFPLKDKARLMNRWYYKSVIKMIESNGVWTYVDSNTGKLDYFTATLVDGQQDYSIPPNALKIKGVAVKDSAGNYKDLKYINPSALPADRDEYLETDGMPREYTITGNSVMLFPAPDANQVTTTAGIKMYASKEVDLFTASDTDQEPGIPEPFHRILSWGASYEWLLLNGDKEKAAAARQEAMELLMELGNFHSERNMEAPTRIRPAHNTHNYV